MSERVCVIGAGYTGIEIAEAFRKNHKLVTLIDRLPLPMWSEGLEVSHLFRELLLSNKIDFYGDVKALRPVIRNNSVHSIEIDGYYKEFDIVVVCTGVRPNNSLALQSGLRTGTSGGLTVDRRLRTNDQFIYASGDNLEVTDFITGRQMYLPLASIAHKTAHIAGQNAAGGNVLNGKIIRNVALKFFDSFYASAGLTVPMAENYSIRFKSVSSISDSLVKVMPQSRKVFGTILYRNDNKKIIGGTFLGPALVAAYADIVSTAIYAGLTVKDLEHIDFHYTPPLSPFSNLLINLSKKAE